MSNNDGILLRELPDGSWQAHHYFLHDDEWPPLKVYTNSKSRGYICSGNSLLQITNFTKDAARHTEYGIYVVYHEEKYYGKKDQIADEIAGLPFLEELTALIEKYSRGSESGTPDDVLARFLNRQLMIFSETVQERANWRGESIKFPVMATIPGGPTIPVTKLTQTDIDRIMGK